jgi:hypothetical protein
MEVKLEKNLEQALDKNFASNWYSEYTKSVKRYVTLKFINHY